jgi:hypothetical protein
MAGTERVFSLLYGWRSVGPVNELTPQFHRNADSGPRHNVKCGASGQAVRATDVQGCKDGCYRSYQMI